MDELFVKKLQIYSPLHDIGKIGIPKEILNKTDRYTEEEYNIMKNHVKIGLKMLDTEGIDDMAKNIVKYHHEKWDGTGYLTGLKGNDIPIEARIVSIADVFDALTSKRVYKESISMEQCLEIIKNGDSIHFDPELTNVFLKNIKGFLKLKDED